MNKCHDSYGSRGFTLAELAVVLVIVGLLLGGLMVPLAAQMDVRYRSDTGKALADAREALIGFAVINGRLPCPAERGIVTGNTNAGVEATTAVGGPCACTGGIAAIGAATCAASSVTGVLPWATLGLPETDAWNNRYTYRVTTLFGRVANGLPPFGAGCAPTTPPANAAFALCSPGNITIAVSSGGTPIASNLPAVVVSHGKNGLGAWIPNGTQAAGPGVGDEWENYNDDPAFVRNTNIDDQLIWISPNLLMNRMIAAGKLP